MDKSVGAKVRELRLQASMSAVDAARICGLELKEYLDGEAGARRLSARELYKLCRELQVPMTNFFDDLPRPD